MSVPSYGVPKARYKQWKSLLTSYGFTVHTLNVADRKTISNILGLDLTAGTSPSRLGVYDTLAVSDRNTGMLIYTDTDNKLNHPLFNNGYYPLWYEFSVDHHTDDIICILNAYLMATGALSSRCIVRKLLHLPDTQNVKDIINNVIDARVQLEEYPITPDNDATIDPCVSLYTLSIGRHRVKLYTGLAVDDRNKTCNYVAMSYSLPFLFRRRFKKRLNQCVEGCIERAGREIFRRKLFRMSGFIGKEDNMGKQSL